MAVVKMDEVSGEWSGVERKSSGSRLTLGRSGQGCRDMKARIWGGGDTERCRFGGFKTAQAAEKQNRLNAETCWPL
jgi:hypothetical protein